MNDYLREMCSYPGLYYRLAKVKKIITPKQVPYGDNRHQYFLHFAPNSASAIPCKNKVIVWIHGGGWNAGTPKDFNYVGQCFALEGYHCLSLGYRLSPKHKYPTQIEDVCTAFRKGMEYLQKQGIDCSRIIVTGPSAGAHLATILCYSSEYQKKYQVDTHSIAGCIGVAGPYCLQGDIGTTLRLLLKQLLPKGYDPAKAEPFSLLSTNSVPLLLIHSKHDGLIDFSMAKKLYEKANALGICCELYEVTDKQNTHSVYSAGMFLETRATNQALNTLFTWIEKI